MVGALLETVFAGENHEAAREQWRKVADQWRERFDRLARLVDRAEDDVLASLGFHPDQWTKIGSTNPLEQNDECTVCRRYTSLETLAHFGQIRRVRPPAVFA